MVGSGQGPVDRASGTGVAKVRQRLKEILDSARFVPTRRLAIAVLVTAPVWLLSGSEHGLVVSWAVTAALILAVTVDGALSPARASLAVDRVLPSTVGVGDEAAGSYEVHSTWRLPVRGLLFDRLPRGVERLSPAPAALRMTAGRTALVPLIVRGRERGLFPTGPIVLRVLGPLGLLQRTLRYDPGDEITVAPSMAGVRRLRLLSLQRRLPLAGVRAIRRRGEGTTFANLREYALGDDPRHVDWKATARRRKLITREYTVEQGQSLVLAIDAGRMMTQLSGTMSRFEYALASALVLADVAVHSGDQVGLLVFDDQVRTFIPPMRGGPALQRIRDALIPARASMVEPDYAAAFRALAARHRKRSLIILYSDVIDTRASHAVIAHTVRSAAHHLPLLVALRNDALVETAQPTARLSTAALYRSAAAEELLTAREEALTAMRRAGVSVVDVSPQAMGAAVVNRYLEIKARGSL